MLTIGLLAEVDSALEANVGAELATTGEDDATADAETGLIAAVGAALSETEAAFDAGEDPMAILDTGAALDTGAPSKALPERDAEVGSTACS